MYCYLLLSYLSSYRWKNVIYQLRKWLKIYKINQRLQLSARVPIAVLLQRICTGELSELFTLLYSIAPEKNTRENTKKIRYIQ